MKNFLITLSFLKFYTGLSKLHYHLQALCNYNSKSIQILRYPSKLHGYGGLLILAVYYNTLMNTIAMYILYTLYSKYSCVLQ